MKKVFQYSFILIFLLALSHISFSQAPIDRHKAHPIGTTSLGMGYYEYVPSNYNQVDKHPVVIFLHGTGEAGNGDRQLVRLWKHGPFRLIKEGWDLKFISIAPQDSTGLWEDSVGIRKIIKWVISNYKVDPARVYVTGLSAGGWGTWRAGAIAPDLVAAIVPVSGCGNIIHAPNLKDVRVWAFHNKGDRTVPSECDVNMVNAVNAAGGNAQLTLYPVSGHDAYTPTYYDEKMWQWLLNQKKNLSTVNQIPLVSAGEDKTIVLPTNSTSFKATASDPEGSAISYLWSQVEGPEVTLSNASTSTLSLSSLVVGTYVFRVLVRDNNNAVSYDEVALTVNPAPTASNLPPTVDAGEDKVVTLPINYTFFTAKAADKDGNVSSYSWTQISGPSVTVSGTNTATLNLSSLVAGKYVFKITVKDDQNASASDQVELTVEKEAVVPNINPEVTGGEDKTITLPENTATFTAIATDKDGTVSSYTWTQVSGPAATLTGATTATVKLSALVAGIYVFKITVKDDRGGTASDEVRLTVNPPSSSTNIPPSVNGGADIKIYLPENTAFFNALASDADGTIASYTWTQVSGPDATLSDASTATLKVTSLEEGTYVFKITVEDDKGASSSDEVKLTVFPEPIVENLIPTVDAGSDFIITLPAEQHTLTAEAEDEDGTITAYAWTQVSGPTVTLAGENATSLVISALVPGTYVFKVTVTDNQNATASDEVKLTVNPDPATGNTPNVNAGEDKVVILPAESVTISATPSGPVSSIQWTQISGPPVDLQNATESTLQVSGLVEGVYVFRITVTSNSKETASDDVKVTVTSQVTGIEETIESTLKLFPTHSSDQFKLQIASKESLKVKMMIINSSGIVVQNKDLWIKDGTSSEVSVSSLPSALYFVKVSTKGKHKVLKFFKD